MNHSYQPAASLGRSQSPIVPYSTVSQPLYWHQAAADPASWITRWEFVREPPAGYAYPQSHIHVNARPAFYTGLKPYPDLHIPTGHRVTIEGVLEHLVREHEIGPISENWETILADAKAEFREIQERRVKMPR